MKHIKIALLSRERIGQEMAGSAIRCYELAKTLAGHFDVTLLSPEKNSIDVPGLRTKAYNSKKMYFGWGINFKDYDIIIAQPVWPALIKKLKRLKKVFVADLYDPVIIESQDYAQSGSNNFNKKQYNFQKNLLLAQLWGADHFLYASERQLHFYLDLMCQNKESFNKGSFDLDRKATCLPFGLSSQSPRASQPGLLETEFPQIQPNNKIIIWGGGIWNWFDPLSAIKAIEKIAHRRNDIKLFFLGVKHPNPKIGEMAMATKALEYCKRKKLINKLVFFHFGWTPYIARVDYLTRATAGISTHFRGTETYYSFRTRILDYLWAELPMILTKGDILSAMAEKEKLGRVVGYKDVDAIAAAIIEICENSVARAKYRSRINKYKPRFYWENVVQDFIAKLKKGSIEVGYTDRVQFNHAVRRFFISALKKRLS